MKINEIDFEYFDHEYNTTWKNERHIEVPLGKYFINKFSLDCIEVGAVMPHYGCECKIVIDPFDDYKNCLRINALDFSYINENVLSISTVEHFKPDEYQNRTQNDGYVFIQKVIKESKNYLITWPIGYNSGLDSNIKDSNINRFILKRINQQNEWIKTDSNNFDFIYNYWNLPITSGYTCGNAICVVTNLEELL